MLLMTRHSSWFRIEKNALRSHTNTLFTYTQFLLPNFLSNLLFIKSVLPHDLCPYIIKSVWPPIRHYRLLYKCFLFIFCCARRQPNPTIIVQLYTFKFKGQFVVLFLLPLLMGGANSKNGQEQKKNSLLDEWETIDHLRDFNIVRNKKDGRIGEVRKFRLNPAYDPKQEMEIYRMRQTSEIPIVKSYGSELLQKVSRKKAKNENNDGMCANNNHMGVITERIPFTLKNLPQISFQESLYILKQTLTGYEYLYPKTGPVHVNQNKIAINDHGKVKVWISEDWSQNHTNDQITSLSSTRNQRLDRQYNLIAPQFRDQKEMTQNIIDVIEDKCQYGNFPHQFAVLIRQNGHSLTKAKDYVVSYIKDRNLWVPDQIHEKTILMTKKGLQDFQIHQRQIEQRQRIKSQNEIKYERQARNNGVTNKIQQNNGSYGAMIYYDAEKNKKIPTSNPNNLPTTGSHSFLTHQISGTTFQTSNLNNERNFTPTYKIEKRVSADTQRPKVNFGGKTY